MLSGTLETTTVSIRGGMFEAQVFTKGGGSPLLFLHGWGGMPAWPSWLDAYAEHFRVIAPQHPGFGASTGIEHLDDMVDLAIYYLDFVDALGLQRFNVIGHSFGGAIAAELAALGSHCVDRLVLVAPVGLWLNETPVLDFFAVDEATRIRALWHDAEAARERGLLLSPPDNEARVLLALDQARSAAAAAKFLWPIPDKGLKKRIHRVKAPTLVVWGDSDSIVPPAYGRLFRDKLANARLVTIPQCGHIPMLEQPEAFNAAVLPFLTGG